MFRTMTSILHDEHDLIILFQTYFNVSHANSTHRGFSHHAIMEVISTYQVTNSHIKVEKRNLNLVRKSNRE